MDNIHGKKKEKHVQRCTNLCDTRITHAAPNVVKVRLFCLVRRGKDGTTVLSAKSAPPSLCVFAINGFQFYSGKNRSCLADTG